MSSTVPLVCDMDVFTTAQRETHIQTTMELIQGVQSIREIENGFEFRFPNETGLISKIAAFIVNERLCCPFLEFDLRILSNDEPVSLLLTGPVGTQEFLRHEFGGAIP